MLLWRRVKVHLIIVINSGEFVMDILRNKNLTTRCQILTEVASYEVAIIHQAGGETPIGLFGTHLSKPVDTS